MKASTFGLMIYMDETYLSGSGSQTAKPMFCSSTILNTHVRQLERAWRLVALLPLLNPPKGVKKQTVYREYKVPPPRARAPQPAAAALSH